jgi:hypothetical protein
MWRTCPSWTSFIQIDGLHIGNDLVLIAALGRYDADRNQVGRETPGRVQTVARFCRQRIENTAARARIMPAADFVALISIAAVLTAAWIAGSAMSWARAFVAVITIAGVLAAAWIMLR